MTTDLRPTENLLTASLDRHAAEAPADDALLSGVHRRLRRRRTTRAVGAVVLGCAAVVSAVAVGQSLSKDTAPGTEPSLAAPQTEPSVAAARPGWRWESYKNVQVQVPATWSNYVSGPAPCPGFANTDTGTIGRFSPWLNGRRTCGVAVMPLAERQEYLWFDDVQKPGVKKYDGGWTEETRDVGGVHVSVLTRNDALREEILGSAMNFSGRDAYGCESSISRLNGSAQRPEKLGTVTAVEICEYWGGGVSRPPGGPLIAGSRLVGQRAAALADALNQPQSSRTLGNGCSDDGGRTYELTVHGTGGTWRGAVTRSGCSATPQPLLELIRTGAHKPYQPSDLIDLPSTFVPPER